ASSQCVIAHYRSVRSRDSSIRCEREEIYKAPHKRDRWPELSLSAGRSWTRHPFGAAGSVGLGLELPVFDTRRAQMDKAESEARAAEARRLTVLTETEAAIRQLQQTLERRRVAFDRHRTEIGPRLERLKQMSADAYSLGRLTLLESLDAEQARLE